MLKLFNSKNPIVVILYPLISFGFFYFYPNFSVLKQNIHNNPFFYEKLLESFGKYFQYFYTGFGIIFLSASAIFFNLILRKTKIIKHYNQIGGFMYLLSFGIVSKYLDILQVSITTFFFLFTLYFVISSFRKDSAVFDFFNAGFAFAVSSFFWFGIIWYFPVIIFGLFIFRSVNFREFLTSLTGLFLPYFFFFSVWFFIHSDFNVIFDTYQLFFIKTGLFKVSLNLKIITAIISSVFLYSAVQTLKNYKLKDSDIQDFYTFFILIFITGSVLLFFFIKNDFSYISVVLLSFSIPLSIYMTENSNKLISEILFDIFLLTVVFSQSGLFG